MVNFLCYMREGEIGDEPGVYLKQGYVITSRGCPNRCWFCQVWRRDGDTRELSITDGWNILDDNLLACSEKHIRAVFEMLKRQPRRVQFTGGLEAARLKDWHVELLVDLNPQSMFFAYDTPDDYEPLLEAGKKLTSAGLTMQSRKVYAYVLIGYPKDSFEDAEHRLWQTVDAGFVPFAMLYRDSEGAYDRAWRRLQRSWCRPAAIMSQTKERSA